MRIQSTVWLIGQLPSSSEDELMSSRGQDLGFYREVPTILAELRRRKIHIAAASRTSAPELYVHPFPFLAFQTLSRCGVESEVESGRKVSEIADK